MSWTDDLHDDLVAAAGRRRRVRARRAGAQAAVVAGVLALGAGVAVAAIDGGAGEDSSPVAARPTVPTQAPATAPTGVRVVVVNATDVPGLASRVGRLLQARGWLVPTVVSGIAERSATTRIFATQGHLDEARTLADQDLHLPTTAVRPLQRPTDIGRAAPHADVVVEAGADLASGIPAQVVASLTGVGSAAKAVGTVRRTGAAVSLTFAGLPKDNHYGLWVGGRFLGFLAPAAGASGVVHGVATLEHAGGEVLVTREPRSAPKAPGTVMLRGRLP